MKCDICSTVLSDAGHRIANSEFKTAVSGGFNPYEVAGFQLPKSMLAMQVAMGMTKSELAAGWRTRTLQDTTDWVLCDACHPIYLTATEEARKREAQAAERQLEERERRRETEAQMRQENERKSEIQRGRRTRGECIMCGMRLGTLDRVFRRPKHRLCSVFAKA